METDAAWECAAADSGLGAAPGHHQDTIRQPTGEGKIFDSYRENIYRPIDNRCFYLVIIIILLIITIYLTTSK